MNFLVDPTFALFFAFILFLTFICLKETKRPGILLSKNKVLAPAPPAPWKLPFIGNLHQMLMTRSSIVHTILAKLAEKYGPIMQLNVGQISMVVISSAELAEAAFTTNDLALAQRPDNVFLETITYNNSGIALSPYGNHWRFFRKLCSNHVLNLKHVQSFKSIREDEVSKFTNSIYTSKNTVVNLSKKLLRLTSSIVSRATIGRKINSKSDIDDDCDDDELTFLLNRLMTLRGSFIVYQMFPSLEILHRLSGLRAAAEDIHWKMDKMLDDILEEHKSKCGSGDEEEYLVDVLISLQANPESDVPITRDIVKAIILDMLIAGLENSATIIEWAMAELLRNPRILQKAQAEVREALKGNTGIEETNNIQEQKYLKAIVKETLRLHPPIPVIPRETRENCEIGGYLIPKNTKFFINAWAIGRDPKYWKDDPDCFYPERFLQPMSLNYEYIPFGGGKRMCPGISFGITVVELTLAYLLYCFDWKLPNGIKPQELDMTELYLVTAKKKKDLLVVPIPYIPRRG